MDALDQTTLQGEIDRELRLVDSAIALVRNGGARRVTVANLRLGGALLESARARASLYRLRVTADWSPGDGWCALIVDRAGADG
jgi:hypothetical protein